MICKHPKYSDGHCAESYCPLYSNRCPRHTFMGDPRAECTLEKGQKK